MSDDLLRLGELLEEFRSNLGLSAREVADRAGISPAYLRSIEKGSNPKTGKPSRPSPEAIAGLARALAADPEELFELAGYGADVLATFLSTDADEPARGAAEDLLRRIQDAMKGLNRRTPFMYARTVERLEEFTTEFRAMAAGTLRVTPEDEPYLTRLAVQECRSHLRAVSYQDELWWLGDDGDRYLEGHERLRERDVEITRIFIVAKKDLQELRPVFERHIELGISTYVLPLSDVSDSYWQDFVLYDERLLRTAASTAGDPTTDRKIAEFTDDAGRIAQAMADFNALLRLAQRSRADVEHVVKDLR